MTVATKVDARALLGAFLGDDAHYLASAHGHGDEGRRARPRLDLFLAFTSSASSGSRGRRSRRRVRRLPRVSTSAAASSRTRRRHDQPGWQGAASARCRALAAQFKDFADRHRAATAGGMAPGVPYDANFKPLDESAQEAVVACRL
jgi:hypothetical protein